MKTLNCIIADDEPIARSILENYISEIPNLNLVAQCKNAFEVMDFLQNNHADVLFLDINMPKLSGLSLLKSQHIKPQVIITTAYPEYAIEGFELSVTDYLLKPFSLERFLQAVMKVQKEQPKQEASFIPIQEESTQHIFVKSDKKIIRIAYDSIDHIEAYGNYIKLYTDKMILTPNTLSNFLDKLPENFIRIHKSFVINFDKLKSIEGNMIMLTNGAELPIGKSYKKELMVLVDKR